jgi:hypothetical protein
MVRQPSEYEPLRGTLILGEVGSGKTTLLMRKAASRFTQDNMPMLFVGEKNPLYMLSKLLPADRIVTEVSAIPDAHETSKTLVIEFNGGDLEPRLAAYRVLCDFLEYCAKPHAEATILAVDGLFALVPKDDTRHFLELLTGAINKEGGITLLATFPSFVMIERIFGKEGLRFFSRLAETALLQTHRDDRSDALAQHFIGCDTDFLRPNKALIISHSLMRVEPIN